MLQRGDIGPSPCIRKFFSVCFATVAIWPAFWPICRLLVRRCEKLLLMTERLSNFRMVDCQCSDESDKIPVHRRVEETWSSLDFFDVFVRQEIYNCVTSAIGHPGVIPYSMLLAMSMPYALAQQWKDLHTPNYNVFEYSSGNLILMFTMLPLSASWFPKCASMFHSGYPRSPKQSATLTLLVACPLTSLHIFVHKSVFWLAFRQADSYGLSLRGGCMICTLLGFEVLWLTTESHHKALRIRIRLAINIAYLTIWSGVAFWLILIL